MGPEEERSQESQRNRLLLRLRLPRCENRSFRAHWQRAELELGDKDSNLDKRSQNPSQVEYLGASGSETSGNIEQTETDGDQEEPMLPHPAAASEPTDAELERGILDALARGLDGVARALSERLAERR